MKIRILAPHWKIQPCEACGSIPLTDFLPYFKPSPPARRTLSPRRGLLSTAARCEIQV